MTLCRRPKALCRPARALNLPPMRRLSCLAVCLFVSLAAARAADVEFVRVWPAWRDADSFARISEYFTNQENTGREVVVRTHADVRAGYYFLSRVRSAAAIGDARFVVQVVVPGQPEPKSCTFPASMTAGSKVFQLGLTGADWTDPKLHPVAWHIELQTADGRVLAQKSSFLWEAPRK